MVKETDILYRMEIWFFQGYKRRYQLSTVEAASQPTSLWIKSGNYYLLVKDVATSTDYFYR